MKTIRSYMKRYWLLYLIGFTAMAIVMVLEVVGPQLTQRLIDDVITGGQESLLMPLLLGVLGIGLAKAVFQYVKEFLFDYIGVTAGCVIRKDLFRHIQRMSMGFFDRHNTGELMTRVKDDVDRVWSAMGFIGSLTIEAVVHTVLVLVCMVRISPWLTLVPLCLLPVIGFCAVRMENGLGEVYDEISEETAELNTVAQECIAGVRTVKAFAQEDYEVDKFSRHNHRYYGLNMRQATLMVRYQPAITFLGNVMLVAVVVVGGLMVITDRLTLGNLGAFLEYANNVIWPMEIAGWLSNDLASAFASWKKIRKVADQEPELTEAKDAKALPRVRGAITFEHVGYSVDGHEILHDVSFHLEPGQTLGVMGMTGAGKTTIVNLLQRFYDVTEGRILLDGADIRTLPLSQLRASMSAVLQDVFLFSDSVTENVRMGRRDEIDGDTVEWALERAGAAEFVHELEKGSDTIIGERGVGLSGGQKQRISIARALSRRTPVLILDDATSALDMETERLLQHNLSDVGPSTKIIIGHRISSVRGADEIIVLDGHGIAERGTHEELMERRGRYYETWKVQYGEEGTQCR